MFYTSGHNMIYKHRGPFCIQEHGGTLCQIRLIPTRDLRVCYSGIKSKTEEPTVYQVSHSSRNRISKSKPNGLRPK